MYFHILLCAYVSFIHSSSSVKYPEFFRNASVVDNYHGTLVHDPYRWLEENTTETRNFIQVENNFTANYLSKCTLRNQWRTKLKSLWNFPIYYPPSKHGERYYFWANAGLLDHDILYSKDSLNSPAKVVLDPNSIEGKFTIPKWTTQWSRDGSIVAYGTCPDGADWIRIHFKYTDVADKREIPDVLTRLKFSAVEWTYDNAGVFYAGFPHMKEGDNGVIINQQVLYHYMGTNQSEDIVVAEFPKHPNWLIRNVEISKDGHTVYLVIDGDGEFGSTIVYAAKLPTKITTKLELKAIVPAFIAEFELISATNTTAYLKTNLDAPNYKVISIDMENPGRDQWKTVVPEDKLRVIDSVGMSDRTKLVIVYLKDVRTQLTIWDVTGKNLVDNFDSLEVGNIMDHSYSPQDPMFFFQYESFLIPNRIYMINFTAGNTVQVFHDTVLPGIDPEKYEAYQIFYPSKDGTKIPMFIVHKKNLVKNGKSFTNLFGYGGFGISSQPTFSVVKALFMQNFDGVVAVANIRGGGEYGKKWHDAGKLDKKQNGFDDFEAAAKYLISENYTTSSRLIIEGRSNGGLLVAACVNQNPNLYGAALPHVGVMDMLRYQKYSVGSSLTGEYGNSDDPKQFEFLYKYSPLQNIRMPSTGQYPAMLVMTSEQDDRVVPAHSFKYTAELQHSIGSSPNQTNPLLIRIDKDAGHGGDTSMSKLIEEYVDTFAFLVESIGLGYNDAE